MTQDDPTAHERRIAELERRVEQLEARMAAAAPAAPAKPAPRWPPVPPRSPTQREPVGGATAHATSRDDWFNRGEGWLGRAGVALVVFGLIFLFRYAVDRGWLTPELRVATGLLVGGGLLGAGLRFFPERRRYRQILMAGGVLVLFITGLAASELYALVPGALALLFNGLVAIGALAIARRQRDEVMASIGSVGALVPPALLLHDAVVGPVFWLYLALMTAWSALLVARHAPSLFALLAVAAAMIAMFQAVAADAATRVAALAMYATVWVGFAALPLLRRRLAWAAPLHGAGEAGLAMRLVQPLAVTAAVGGAVQEALPGAPAGEIVSAAGAAAFALVGLVLWRDRVLSEGLGETAAGSGAGEPGGAGTDRAAALEDASAVVAGGTAGGVAAGRAARAVTTADDFSAAAAAVAVCLAAFGVAAFPGQFAILGVAAVAAAAWFAAAPLRVPLLGVLTHALFAACAIDFLSRVATLSTQPPFDPWALARTGVVALAAVVMLQARGAARLAYAAGVFAAVHVLLATELGAIAAAPWLGSASWAAVGAGLVIAGLHTQKIRIQQAGMLSLALLVGRLFLHDLANADTGVRIVLFLACGFGFLGLSYLFRGRRRAGSVGPEQGESAA